MVEEKKEVKTLQQIDVSCLLNGNKTGVTFDIATYVYIWNDNNIPLTIRVLYLV